ncbi:MAG TPA: hypothetical protein VH877_16950 [Polyangia bacterium]|jgi:hypothetical protein|nr:hypothetical protein [Polyangia bacterium]
MGLLTRTEDRHLEEARREVVASERVCPHCKATITISGATLTTFQAAVGMEGHTCPACGQLFLVRRPSPDGL